MEASQTKTKKPKGPQGFGALVLKEGVPHYELAADKLKIAMAHRTDGGIRLQFPTVLSVPDPERVFELLEAQKVVTRPVPGADGVVEDVRLNVGAEAKFFDEHVVEIFYRNQQRKFSKDEIERLDIEYNFKNNTVNRGLLRVLSPAEDYEESLETEDPLPSNAISTTPLAYLLADEDGDEHRIHVSLTFRPKTAADAHEMRRSIRMQTLKDRSQLTIIKHRRLSKLFQSMIRGAPRGLLINGEACTEENRSEWVEKVPVQFQFNAVMRQYRGVDSGN
jgi:hypothetical protein